MTQITIHTLLDELESELSGASVLISEVDPDGDVLSEGSVAETGAEDSVGAVVSGTSVAAAVDSAVGSVTSEGSVCCVGPVVEGVVLPVELEL